MLSFAHAFLEVILCKIKGALSMNIQLKNIITFTSIKKIIWKIKCHILILMTTGCYSGIMHNQTMPFAEGWYTYYSQCINRGEVVYKDFDYLFTPLYIHFVALFTKIFGYDIIALRVLGILFFCLIAIFIFLAFREVFDENISVIATITAVFYLQSEVVQVFYDYVRLYGYFFMRNYFFSC